MGGRMMRRPQGRSWRKFALKNGTGERKWNAGERGTDGTNGTGRDYIIGGAGE